MADNAAADAGAIDVVADLPATSADDNDVVAAPLAVLAYDNASAADTVL